LALSTESDQFGPEQEHFWLEIQVFRGEGGADPELMSPGPAINANGV